MKHEENDEIFYGPCTPEGMYLHGKLNHPDYAYYSETYYDYFMQAARVTVPGDRFIKKNGGMRAFMCPECYGMIFKYVEYEDKTTLGDDSKDAPRIECSTYREFFIEECPECGAKFVNLVELDFMMGNIISLLNRKGYKTLFCCEGHVKGLEDHGHYESERHQPYITFDPSIDIVDECMHDLPLSWSLDIRYTAVWGAVSIISYFTRESDEYLYDLLDWVESLPKISPRQIKSDAEVCKSRLWQFQHNKATFEVVNYPVTRLSESIKSEIL